MRENPAWIISRKRDGEELTAEQIRGFVEGITSGEIPDYQATALLMAVYFQGMTLNETMALTGAMLDSGIRYDLSHIPGSKVDKHSTGGVGDKVSLILAPLAAACGVKVPMMSGRGLGHSGGTLDKLESISGFDVRLPRERFEEVLAKIGCCMIGQSEKIAPADRKLYALRDVTGTVECIPLITASILSKKLAEGAEALVLDVKVGSGAFMKSREQARKLARTLTQVARKMGLPCRSVLTDMNQPLGYAVGNALEVRESIAVLMDKKEKNLCSTDLKELTVQLCAHMLEVSGTVKTLAEGRKLALKKLADGSAWKIFREMVKLQGGAVEQILTPSKLPQAPELLSWKAPRAGYLTRMDTEAIGRILLDMGGGRRKASDSIDPAVGMVFHKKLGAKVRQGETLVTAHLSSKTVESGEARALEERFLAALEISGARKPVPKLILEVL